jgi:hypothetical protein
LLLGRFQPFSFRLAAFNHASRRDAVTRVTLRSRSRAPPDPRRRRVDRFDFSAGDITLTGGEDYPWRDAASGGVSR